MMHGLTEPIYRELGLRHTGIRTYTLLKTYDASAIELYVLTRIGYFVRHAFPKDIRFSKHPGVCLEPELPVLAQKHKNRCFSSCGIKTSLGKQVLFQPKHLLGHPDFFIFYHIK